MVTGVRGWGLIFGGFLGLILILEKLMLVSS